MGVVHSEDLKREVVAKWQVGDISKKQLSREYGLDPATVRRWCNDPSLFPPLPSFRRISHSEAPTPKAMIDAGQRILELVDSLVASQQATLQLALDPEWLRAQTPEDLRGWFDAWGDRTFRILDAISRGEELRQSGEAADRAREAEAAGLAGPAGDGIDEGYGPPLGAS